MANAVADQLHEAIARNAAVVLSLPSAGISRHYRSRFLARQTDGSIWVETANDADALVHELIATRKPVGVAFKWGSQKVTFASPLLRLDERFVINYQTRVSACLLGAPDQLLAEQRRSCYRVRVFDDSDLTARIWRIPDHAELQSKPVAASEVHGQLIDISVGGLGARLSARNAGGPKIVEGERLRIELVYCEQPLLLEGRIRPMSPPAAPDEHPRVGVRFEPLDKDLPSRQKGAQLAKIVGELQRAEARRVRHSRA